MFNWLRQLLGVQGTGERHAGDAEAEPVSVVEKSSVPDRDLWEEGRREDDLTKSEVKQLDRYKGVPRKALVVDVETTGLNKDDRMVSFAGIILQTESLENDLYDIKFVHFIFDPGFKGGAEAERIHGYSDWFLRHQPFAVEELDVIEGLINEADVIIAHNAAFDLDFISRDFAAAGREMPVRPVFCTMQAWRARYPGFRANLNAACRHIGISRRSERHGALEDAWLALQVYLHLNAQRHVAIPVPPEMPMKFANERPVPPMPEGPLPRRKRRRKVQTGGGRRLS